MEFLSSFSPMALRFDAFILDLWGVIHDGQKLYPGAKDCLERLRAEGKKIVLLSNAPRRAATAAEALTRMGVSRDNYDALITSGEAAHRCLGDSGSLFFRPEGDRYIYVGLERDRRILEGLPYTETDNPAEAHFLILSHSFHDNQPLSELEPLLAHCLSANIPAICVNPDMEVVRQTGEHVYCAGVLAKYYAEQGGQVIYFGKPHPVVYEMAFAALAGTPKARIAVVGDNLATDILGGNKTGTKSVLVTGGVLLKAVGEPISEGYEARCNALLADSHAKPDYVIPAFNW